MSGTFACFWCRAAVPRGRLTLDHLIPQWAVRLFPELLQRQVHLRACIVCNGNKGGMPPALYVEVRDTARRRDELNRWQVLQQLLAIRGWSGEIEKVLKAYVIAEMSKPLPSQFDVVAHREAWLATGRDSAKKAKRGADFRPAMASFAESRDWDEDRRSR